MAFFVFACDNYVVDVIDYVAAHLVLQDGFGES